MLHVRGYLFDRTEISFVLSMSQMCLLIFRIISFESFVALSGDADVGLTVALSEIRWRSNVGGGMDINTCPVAVQTVQK